MWEAIGSLLTTLRQSSPVVLLGISIASGAILFIPEEFAAIFGLSGFRHQYRAYIGGLLIVSSSLVLAQLFWRLCETLKSKWDNSRRLADMKRSLHDLTPDEKAYLSPFILANENTQYFLIEDGIACGLEDKHILYRPSEIGNMSDGFAFNMRPWARKYLKKKLSLLEGANPEPNDPRDWNSW